MPNVNETVTAAMLPEPCPAPTEFQIAGCQDALKVPLADTPLLSLGRIVQVDVTIKSVCPGKRVAASILLVETDETGAEFSRGAKHILIPAQEGTGCRDVTLRCIPFSLPEALDSTGLTDSICNARNLKVRVFANYVDTDFVCCDAEAATV